MAKLTKKQKHLAEKVEADKVYDLREAIDLLSSFSSNSLYLLAFRLKC